MFFEIKKGMTGRSKILQVWGVVIFAISPFPTRYPGHFHSSKNKETREVCRHFLETLKSNERSCRIFPFFCGKKCFFSEFFGKNVEFFFNEIDCKKVSRFLFNESSSKKLSKISYCWWIHSNKISKSFYCWIHRKKNFKFFYSQFYWKKKIQNSKKNIFATLKKKRVRGGGDRDNFSRKIWHDLLLGFNIYTV